MLILVYNRDHPRSRGEYRAAGVVQRFCSGSSPLSRGIQFFLIFPPDGFGIIPALAGNTTPAAGSSKPRRDHPRSRGEYCAGAAARSTRAGSSPLSRGIHRRPGSILPEEGIIPALAGNTLSGLFATRFRQDHPRSRGEYETDVITAAMEWGSSPLSRGIPRRWDFRPAPRRIIPALAGNTPSSEGHSPESTDHPRSRGEYFHC